MSSERHEESNKLTGPEVDVVKARGRWRAIEAELPVYGELFFLALIVAFWTYMLYESFQWRYFEAKLIPRIVIPFGIPFLLIRLWILMKHLVGGAANPYGGIRNEEATAGQIMDLGFYLAPGALRRFLLGTGSVIGFVVGVWLIGWHTAIPVYLISYLRFMAHLRWRWSIAGGLGFFAFFTVIFDQVIDPFWNDPVLFQWARALVGG